MNSRIPLGLKLGFTAFVLLWVPVYVRDLGPQNFLWLCDFANLMILLGLWLESPLLLSSQLISVFAIGVLWTIDFCSAYFFGMHPLGATQYMFNPEIALQVRLFSLFHGGVWVLVAFAVYRVGYDARGWRLQTIICWLLLPASFFLTEPVRQINWVWGLFGAQQQWVPGWVWLVICMLAYPLVVYLPTHGLVLLAKKMSPKDNSRQSDR